MLKRILFILLFLPTFASCSVNLFVMGVEHAGNRWVKCLMSLHPEVEILESASFPRRDKYFDLTEYLAEQEAKGNVFKIVLVVRDKSCNNAACQRDSAYKRRPELFSRGYGNAVDDAKDVMNIHLSKIPPEDIVVVSYESLLQQRELVLRQTFRLLGISEEDYDYHRAGIYRLGWMSVYLEGRDGNAKYMREDL